MPPDYGLPNLLQPANRTARLKPRPVRRRASNATRQSWDDGPCVQCRRLAGFSQATQQRLVRGLLIAAGPLANHRLAENNCLARPIRQTDATDLAVGVELDSITRCVREFRFFHARI